MTELNLTDNYYKSEYPSLLWEMTICQSLGDGLGSFAKALNKPAAYGELAADFLQQESDLPGQCGRIAEIGGGYGTLMAGLLKKITPSQITMVDISQTLLEKQRETLSSATISYTCQDLFSWLPKVTEPIDLLLLNEIIGDFPTITKLSKTDLQPEIADQDLATRNPTAHSLSLLTETELTNEASRLIFKFNLKIDDLPEIFNFNYGALRFIEILAASPVSRTFITEHGCDTILPYPFSLYPSILPISNLNPRRIQLKDHDEYNIRFDHLEQIAKTLNFKVKRFHLMDILKVRFDDEINYLLTSQKPINEEQEILLEFYEHVAEYQGILIER